MSIVVESAAKRTSRERIEVALKSPSANVTLNFPNGEELWIIAEQVKTRYKIPVYFERRELEDLGVDVRDKVKIEVTNEPLKSALQKMLRQKDLTYRIGDGCLCITTPEAVGSLLVTRVYRVEDLLAQPTMSEKHRPDNGD